MVILLLALAVLLVGLVVAVVTQRLTLPGAPDPVTTESFALPPRAVLTAEDLSGLRFDPALRGYRMAQVDAVLERLAEELRERDAEIARLRRERDVPDGGTTRGAGE